MNDQTTLSEAASPAPIHDGGKGLGAVAGSACPACKGTMIDPAGVWEECDGIKIDFCRACDGSGYDLSKPPCRECGAMTLKEAETKCNCAGDKDHCHGCDIWRDEDTQSDQALPHGGAERTSNANRD